MLVNPYTQRMTALAGTRILSETLQIVGMRVRDGSDPLRVWRIQSLYAPILGRALGGIRAKLVDQNEFSTFVNQRDLEVLMGIAKPGERCQWSGRRYVGPGDEEWFGLCADEEDLIDDLMERELLLRSSHPGILPFGLEVTRRIHAEDRVDYEELLTMLWDMNLETGFGPDQRLESINTRWTRIEQRRLPWSSIPKIWKPG